MANSLIDSMVLPHRESVIKLSSKPLTNTQLQVLQRGLNFCPTPGEPKMGDLVRDMDNFHDNLRWDYHFHDTPVTTTPSERLVMLNKTLKKWSRPPAPPAHKNLEAFIFLNERELQRQKLMEPRTKKYV